MSGTLYIIAAPSGAGKTRIVLSVSYTSRPPRPNEINGVHYHFVSRALFEEMVKRGEFFEHAVVHGDLKGTARTQVEKTLAQGKDVLLEIDWQGARQVRVQMPGTVSIFILPPSRAELERRLRARASDSEETIRRRLADSREDIAHAVEFDYLVVNDDFATALADLRAIVTSRQLRSGEQRERQAALLADLLRGEA
ncbi:MAG: guanylate kinase [Gammaproteobacteria bacterium]|nr:MAG: guanylate kinase [Gammaproteobacteria bacterium]